MRYAPPGMCLNDFAVIGEGPYHLLHLQGPWTPDFDAARLETSYGRASSADLVTWEPQAAAFGVGPPGRFDDSAIWTMHPFQHGQGMAMAYTGVRVVPHPEQSIGFAFSDRTDGTGWRRATSPHVRPDARWYRHGRDEAWRDPWVVTHPEPGIEYAALIAARTPTDALDRAGCVGLAVSADLERWQVLPPLLVPGDINELECPILEARPGGGWLLLGSVAPARQIHAWSAPNFSGPWTALGPIAPPGPYAPRVVPGPNRERLVLHTVPRRVGLHDDGAPCRGMLSQPKLLHVTDDRVRLRWWPGLDRYLEQAVEPDVPQRDILVETHIDGAGSVVIRDNAGPDAIDVTVAGTLITVRTRSGRLLQQARADQTVNHVRILAIGEFIEVYADDTLCLSTMSYASETGTCHATNHDAKLTIRPITSSTLDGRDDASTIWPGHRAS